MIVHVFNSSVVSGPETLVIPALRELGEKAAVIFLSETRCGDLSAGPPAYARSLGLEVHEVEVRSRWDRRAVRELRALLERLTPRIVHAHEVKAAAYVAAAAPRSRTYRLFATNHGVRAKMKPMLRLYEGIFTRLVMPRFDRIVCVCTSDRELLIRRGVPAPKVVVHLNGVTKRKVTDRASASREIRDIWQLGSRGIPEGSLCLGLVGRLAPEKRHGYILDVMKALPPELEAHLIVFGRGPLEEELKRRTSELGLESRVHWMGYRGTVGDEMAGFDALISLSIAEGLPINVIEAGWAATPVVATGVDGNLDLMPSAEYGLLFPVSASHEEVARSLAGLLRDPERRARMGLALQARVERNFSSEVWRSKLVELYE